jgi:hypothetical protein
MVMMTIMNHNDDTGEENYDDSDDNDSVFILNES